MIQNGLMMNMTNNITALIYLFTGGAILTIGDIIMKKWVINNSWLTFFYGMIIYVIGMVFLALSFKHKNIAVASTIFVIFNVITLSIMSWWLFKEPLSNTQMIGIALGILSVIILEIS